MKNKIKNLLITFGFLKPHQTYKGRAVTRFQHDQSVFFSEYIRILNKESVLPSLKRSFVKSEVESWLLLNDIDIKEFQNELRN